MNRHKIFTIVCAIILACGVLLPAARADAWNQKIEITFSQPVEVPGAVLPAGTYWFMLANSDSNRHIVQIFSPDWSTLYATTFAIPTYRQQTHNRVEVRFAERPYNQPEALLKVFYPGLYTGQEFVYHRREERELRRDAKLDLLTTSHGPETVITPGA
jgi:hypothetical protein